MLSQTQKSRTTCTTFHLKMNKEKYLNRIHYTGSLNPTLQVLTKLQEAHLLHIPFENLDIHYGVPIELDIEKLFNKIILNQRGGFCYELNGLFYELLVMLGFDARRISAQVYDSANGYGPPFDHLAIIVRIEDMEYLSDVGFGEFAFAPLRLQPEIMQHDARGDFIIQQYEKDYWRVSKTENNILVPQYVFDTASRELHEFNEMCQYHQTSPQSHFTQNVMITLPTPGGRITITKDKLKIKDGQGVYETFLENEAAFRDMVLKYFAIDLNVASNTSIK